MTFKQAYSELKKCGTAQNRKIYGRHGVTAPMFGVSFANLKKFAKQIKTDQEIAEKLWNTGNHDAKILAAMVVDPEKLKSSTIDKWVKELNNYVDSDMMAEVVAKTKFAKSKMEKWTKSKNEWISRTGWKTLAHLAMKDESISNDYLENYVKIIESNIHKSKNRTRDAMNSALIAIGIRNTKLKKAAFSAAKVIGKVNVDHGQTSCKTPDAVEYIKKTLERRKLKASK